jgi:hypothetical protein
MGSDANFWARYWAARWLGIAPLVLASIVSIPLPAGAQDTAIMRRGDAAVTAFSGARQMGEVPPDLHPLDLTFINPNGATLQVFDLTDLGGAADGQVVIAPIKFKAMAGEIGQVYGVALDGDTANATPNIYVTSTSLFGLQIVSAEGDRLVKGEPGARWMQGQLGKGGTPGSVWIIDGATGLISLFADLKHDGQDNAGPGLGDIAYDSATRQFFVSDLETGLISRLDADGNELDTFDHGVNARPKDDLEPVAYDAGKRMNIESPDFDIEKPSTWGFADKARMVFAVAVQNGRLYYSTAEGPQVWSVGINSDGSFADDARFEIDVADTPKGNLITDIVFDDAGTLYLAQRGELVGSYDYSIFAKPEESAVLRFVWDETEQEWSAEPEEYAIGLKPPYRSTQGGIALNYGYDDDGKIDYDQCRASLWTTGEHLRKGEESDRVYKGGARIIHGLQGNDKDLVRPQNEPPFAAWYVDNDGLYIDANVYGHVGDIAIFDPCDKRTIDESEPPPYPPLPEPEEHVGPGIFIDKICEPAIFGGEIHCIITVTNIGETLSDPVEIWDAATILSGPGAGGGIIIAGIAPDGPDWICSPTPTPDLWCSLPPDAIDPDETRSIDVWIDTGPLFAAGDFGFRNCAALEEPWGGIACDDGGTDITVTKTAPAACMPGADCTFTVTITNDGTLGFAGDVLLTDAMFFPDGTGIPAPITAMVPDLGCVPPPGALDFSCVAPLTLGPGESVGFAITVTMPAMPAMYWAQNCFAISAPGVAPPALPLAPGVDADNRSCAWVPVGGPPPLSNLRVDKTALFGGACYKSGAVIRCDYEIEIINDGPSPYFGPVTFDDTIPAAATLVAPFPGGWGCVLGPPLTCTNPFVGIPVGGSITFPLSLTVPLAPLEIAGCVMPNSATLTAPPAGTDPNFFGGDDTGMAEANAFLFWELPTGEVLVTCDPTNLKVTKVAEGDCVVSDGGYRCDYKVTVTNMGPDPYKGPIEIDDQFGFAPSSVTFPGWGHTVDGAIHHLKRPNVSLEKGDSIELKVTATVPEGKQCKLMNTAALTRPLANTRWNKDPADDAATAWAKIPSPQCVEPERPQCEPKTNELRSESGACVCKTGFVRNEKGLCVGLTEPPVTEPPVTEPPVTEPRLCPDGKPVPKSGRCPEAPPLCEPGPNEERNAQGQCVCKLGYERDKRGNCVKPTVPPKACEANEVRDTKGRCVCAKGFERDRYGRCVKSEDPAGECREKGWTWDGKRCLSPADVCKLKNGVWDGKRCRTQAEVCTAKGWVWDDKRKTCTAPVDPAEECRKKGWRWDGRRCLPPIDPAEECRKKGWKWDGTRCLPPIDPATLCKAKGWKWDDKRKTCTAPVDPAEECKKKGWKWDGKRKTCTAPLDLAEECKKKGWKWDGKRKTCTAPVSPAEECKKKGWKWDSKRKTCTAPVSPAEECKKKGRKWDGKRCLPPSSTIPR